MDSHKIAIVKAFASIDSYGSLSYNPKYRDATVHLVFLPTPTLSCFEASGNFWALTRRKEITGTITLSSAPSDFFFNIPSLPGVVHATAPTFGALFLILKKGWLQSILFSLVALGFQYSATHLWQTIRQVFQLKLAATRFGYFWFGGLGNGGLHGILSVPDMLRSCMPGLDE